MATWRQDGLSWGQVGGQMCQLRAKLALTWVTFDPRMANLNDFGWLFCMILGSVLHMVWIAKTMVKPVFSVGFLHSLGA